VAPRTVVVPDASSGENSTQKTGGPGGPKERFRRGILVAILIMLTAAAAVLWWKWNREWEQLESGLKRSKAGLAEKPPVQVPTEVMQKLLVHKVEPMYPAEARKENVEGIIALDIVVSRDGSVVSMHPLNGPDVLARAAMDALRWWKFSPYRATGEPVAAETTMAVEFKR
jgi:TonB family protein